jgi:phosphoheptose isomerase
MGVFCVGMTGLNPRSRLHECCTIVIRAPSYQTARVQETHLAVCHVLAGLVERHLAPRAA